MPPQADYNEAKPKAKTIKPEATLGETFSFVFGCGAKVKLLFALGVVGGILNGLVYPARAYILSHSFSSLAGASNGLDQVITLAYTFMELGAFALVVATVQNWSLEIVAYHASQNFRLQWFQALLRQDAAFFDVNDIGGMAGQIGPNADKFRRGVGRKFGEGIQFATTGVGGMAFAFYSSWRVAFVVVSFVPVVSLTALMVLKLNQTKGARAAKSYRQASGVAYSAVSSIKTLLSLNAVSDMVSQYKDATDEAFREACSLLWKQGFANGAMMGTFLFLYCILTLYGASLIYKDLQGSGCDPSGSTILTHNKTCASDGASVFGAMLGVAFAAQGISQVGNFFEALGASRVGVGEALQAINRKPGASEQIIYKSKKDDELNSTTRSSKSKASKAASDIEEGGAPEVKAIVPRYEIDSSSKNGLKPDITGAISIRGVHFSYPTRPNESILQDLTLEIKAGETTAFVGPSGGGKSTVISMLERFYDPKQGSILLDGVDLKDINVSYLRSRIGYVGQEPALFATTIRGNIQYGNPNATQEQIEEAARLANAHDFITGFSDGYDTQVGDKGGQLSGGQKQRIAIARVLVGDPKILLLDEATSALDSESELVVQNALDNILETKKITTIIIAHRLSTIRNADTINVVVGGQAVEQGTHDELMARESYYRKLVEKQDAGDDEALEKKEEAEKSVPTETKTLKETSVGDAPTITLSDPENLQPVDIAPTHLEFKSVSFSYPTRPKKSIFSNFNLKIAQGQTVALVGPSGGGKSTVVGMIERFYDPSDGAIEFLGSDIRSLNVAWYRSQLAYVGQEPTLFNMTIAENIAFGASQNISRADIENAAKNANAHDFIMNFAEGYDTPVGAQGLSGGQKQRVAIARALVRKPQVLILDEATSALDNESEAVVQEAIDRLMESRSHTTIVIAHRLSTIRKADRIAFIANGEVLEFGSHDELTAIPDGRYKRLFESSKRRSTLKSVGLTKGEKTKVDGKVKEKEDEIDWEAKIQEEESKSFSAARAREMAKPDAKFMLVGAVGAVMSGGVYPMWGLIFAATIALLFRPVFLCTASTALSLGFSTCEEYWQNQSNYMRHRSYEIAAFWVAVIAMCLIGNMLCYWGFGTASERLNKRVRDSSFLSLLRQEVAFFDMRSVGSITSQLQDDAARIHSFSGEPVRAFIVAISTVLTGVVISLAYMWPLALLSIACIPIMGYSTSLRVKTLVGQDLGVGADGADELNSPGGILIETLLNMRTVSALTLEEKRYHDFEEALKRSESNHRFDGFTQGVTGGLGVFVQQWVNALQFYFGGWLLFKFPHLYSFSDFLIAQFCIVFSLFGLATAFQDMSDRKSVEQSVGRILYLLERKSLIDPLSSEGKCATN